MSRRLCRDFYATRVRRWDSKRLDWLLSHLRDSRPTARARSARPAAGSRKLSVPTATSVAPTSSRSRACAALLTPPMPTTGIATRSATPPPGPARPRGSRDPTDRRCRLRARRGAGPGRPSRVRRERQRPQRVDQRHRVRAARLRRRRAGGDVRRVRRQLDDQRLRRSRAHRRARPASSWPGSAPMSSPVVTFGQDTFSSIAAISARASHASTSSRDLSARRAHHVRDQRHRQASPSYAAGPARDSPPTPVRQSDRVDQAARGLPQPRRRVALRAAASVIVLET